MAKYRCIHNDDLFNVYNMYLVSFCIFMLIFYANLFLFHNNVDFSVVMCIFNSYAKKVFFLNKYLFNICGEQTQTIG